MRSRKRVVETITLEMDRQEADWLRALVQNPLLDDFEKDTEDSFSSEMRKKIFEALK